MSNKKTIDITKLNIEDIIKMDLDDVLIYINEVEDKNTVIICFFNIIKQMTDNSDSNFNIIKYRKTYRKIIDLEDKLDLIYEIIEQNNLPLYNELNDKKNEIEKKLERLQYSNLDDIKKLKDIDENVLYETSLRNFNLLKEEIRLFFGKLCSLYTNVIQEKNKQKRAREDYIEILLKLRDTPILNTNVNVGSTFEEYMLEAAKRAGLVDRKDLEMRETNELKSKKFYDEQEKMKNKKGEII